MTGAGRCTGPDARALHDALDHALGPDDPLRDGPSGLAGATVLVLLDLRSGRPSGLPDDLARLAAEVVEPDLGEAYQRLLGADRASGGVFYTPQWLVALLLDLALDPVLDAATSLDAVLALRVCDPSCGSGRFLVAAARRIGDRLARLGHPDPLTAAVEGCVVGIDVDPVAAALARAALHELSGADGRVLVDDAMAARPAVAAYDVVVGNPPFRSRLRRGAGSVPPEVDGVRLGPYTDLSAAFLVRGLALLHPGGRLALVQPLSLLSARDAGPVLPGTPVLTCAPLLRRRNKGAEPTTGSVQVRVDGRPPREVPVATRRLREGWGFLLADHPSRVDPVSGDLVGDQALCTADFRDQYYGLVGHVVEGDPAPGVLRLLTSGSIDPALVTWGERPIRFARQDWWRPVVRVADLGAPMARWAASRAVPKVLVATQGRVVEAVVDEHGEWLPSVPVLSVLAPPDRLWHLLAAVLSPAFTARAAQEYAGSALSAGAVKLSAAQLAAMPLPRPGPDWDAAADAVRRAQGAASQDDRARHLLDAALASTRAYGADEALVAWWARRAARCVPGIGEALTPPG